jgi:hypothetical protein
MGLKQGKHATETAKLHRLERNFLAFPLWVKRFPIKLMALPLK